MPTWDIALTDAASLSAFAWSSELEALTQNDTGALNDPAVAIGLAKFDALHVFDPVEIGGTAPADADTVQGIEVTIRVKKNLTLNASNTYYGMKISPGDALKTSLSQTGYSLMTLDITGDGWHTFTAGSSTDTFGLINLSGLIVKSAVMGMNIARSDSTPDPATFSNGSDGVQTRILDYAWLRIHYSVAGGGGGTTTALAAAASARYIPGIGIRSQGSIIRRS